MPVLGVGMQVKLGVGGGGAAGDIWEVCPSLLKDAPNPGCSPWLYLSSLPYLVATTASLIFPGPFSVGAPH